MATYKISALTAAAAAAAANELEINEAGTSKKLTVQQVATGALSGVVAPVANTAVSIAAVAPTATTGASQAGKAAALTASAAVASTDTAGAAAGGSVTITAGAAARNTSGNGNGGDVILSPGAGIGAGTAGRTLTFQSLGVWDGVTVSSALAQNGAANLSPGLNLENASLIVWASGTGATASKDVGLARLAAGQIKVTDGSSGAGSIDAGAGWFRAGTAHSSPYVAINRGTSAIGAATSVSLAMQAGGSVEWSSGASSESGFDVGIKRGGAGILDLRSSSTVYGTLNLASAQFTTVNGGQWIKGQASELLTLSTGGATTDTTANLLPANSIIESVVARVTTTITTATNWKLGDATIAGRFTAANATLVAGTTDIGLVHIDLTGTSGPRQTAAAKVRVTTTGTPGAGAIRITVFYRQFVGPTS